MNRASSSPAYLLLVIFGLVLTGCTSSPPDHAVLNYGLTLSPTGIDPHIHASAELGIPLTSVYDTLVVIDPDTGEFVPSLADDWTISPDGLQYTFELRDDVTFHDGTKFDADAVRANIEYTLAPDHNSQKAASLLGPLERVEVLDDYTVEFDLSEPYAPLLDSLAQVYLGMASPTALEKWGVVEYQFHQVGTGPFRFVEYRPNDRLVIERNPDYAWGPSIYQNRTAELERITFRFYEDPATRALALTSGEVDVIGEVPPHDINRLVSAGTFHLYPISIPGQPLQYLFNLQASPTDNILVRQALIHALDRSQITQTVFGQYSPAAEGPLSAGYFGFQFPSDPLDYDPAGATELLSEAGWQFDGSTWTKEGEQLAVEIIAPSWGSNPEVAQLIKAAWEKLGVHVSLEVVPGFGILKERQSEGNYNLIGLNFFGTDPDLLRSFYSTDGFYNWSYLSDPDLDQTLLQAARETNDPLNRHSLYEHSIQEIMDQAIVLPVRDYVNLVVAHNRVGGLRFSAQGWFPHLIDITLSS